MRLRRLTGLERHKIEEELAELREKIAWYQQVLGDVSLVLQIIKDELAEIRAKYADKRRTEIASRGQGPRRRGPHRRGGHGRHDHARPAT